MVHRGKGDLPALAPHQRDQEAVDVIKIGQVEPFFTTKGIGKGTGLGLAMVHGVAEQSGGRLVLRSEMGAGTTAEIWIPVAGALDVVVSPPEPSPQSAAENIFSGPMNILTVDDDELVLQNIVAMLEDLGHTVFQASSAKSAMEILRSAPHIDIVVTDQAMPEMTGMQLADAIAFDWPDLPIILATGFAELPAELPSLLTRLAKPFEQAELSRVISEAVASSRIRLATSQNAVG